MVAWEWCVLTPKSTISTSSAALTSTSPVLTTIGSRANNDQIDTHIDGRVSLTLPTDLYPFQPGPVPTRARSNQGPFQPGPVPTSRALICIDTEAVYPHYLPQPPAHHTADHTQSKPTYRRSTSKPKYISACPTAGPTTGPTAGLHG